MNETNAWVKNPNDHCCSEYNLYIVVIEVSVAAITSLRVILSFTVYAPNAVLVGNKVVLRNTRFVNTIVESVI